MARPRLAETVILTALALGAFAANSLITRRALGAGLIDAATFTAIRLASGALVLAALAGRGTARVSLTSGREWWGPLALFAYAAPFSFAYLRIGAATGALVLFGAVQITMIGWGMARGERPGLRGWLGLAIASGGLVVLALPGVSRPDPRGAALMALAGAAWGVYSLRGKGAADPIAANARGFLLSSPLAAVLVGVSWRGIGVSVEGVLLAVVSGAATSGVGYAIWYRALRGLTSLQAAVLQLTVPVLAAVGAVFLLHERPGPRLLGAGLAVLGGVALALGAGRRGRA